MEIVKTSMHWFHRIFWYTVAGVIITMAIAISLLRIFIPDVKVYRGQIEHVASTFLGQEVHIKSMDARLSGITPMIIFRDVRMLDDSGKHEIMRFDEARLGLDLWRSLSNHKVIPKSFTIYGVKLGITRRKDRTLVLQGLNLSKVEQQFNAAPDTLEAESGELARWLFERSTLVLKHSTVVWHDALRGNKIMRFDDVNFDIRNDGDRHQFTGTITLPRNMGNTLAVAFDFRGNILNPAQWQGQFYTRGNALKVAKWGIKPAILHTTLEKGVLDLEMWGRWQGGTVTALTTKIKTDDFRLNVDKQKKPLDIKLLSGLFDWRQQGSGWRLNIEKLRYQGRSADWPQTRMQVVYHQGAGGQGSVDAYSSYLQINDTLQLLQDLNILDKPARQTITQLSPRGELSDLHVHYQLGDKSLSGLVVSTAFKGLSIKPYQKFPGVDDLDGVLWADRQHGEAAFADSALQLSLPEMFRKPFAITRLEGKLQWWHAYDAWHVRSPDLAFESKDIQTELTLNLSIPDSAASPFLDLQAHFADGDVQQTWRYLPVGIMDNDLVNWLDHGVVDGHIKDGNVLFHGRLRDFPFSKKQGTFVIDFKLEDGLLKYRKGWPPITANELEARFTGQGMSLMVPRGTLYHTHLRNTRVTIDHFRLPVLKVTGKFSGEADDAVRFLVDSPIAPAAASFYRQSKISGGINGQLALSIPLSRRAERNHPAYYKGHVQFKNAGLQAWQQRLVVNNIYGRINFSPSGVSSEKLHGRFSGQPTDFTLYTRDAGQHQIMQVSMQGILDMAKLPGKLPLNGVEKRISGKTPWQGVLSFGSDDPADPGKVSLNIVSRLQGVRFDLPPPLNKSAKQAEDFRLAMTFADNDRVPLTLKVGNILNAALLLHVPTDQPSRIEKGVVQFSRQPAVLPKENQFVIRGSIPKFPLDEWQAIRKQLATTANMSSLDSLGLPVVLDMDYLNVTTQQDAKPLPADDPRKAGLLNGQIRDLVYDDMQLGHLQIKTSRQANGIHFDTIKLDAQNLKLKGEGSWFLRDGKQHTNILVTLFSDNVGSMITRLGYKGVIRNAKARAVMQLDWDDSPNRFSFAKLNGTLGTVINDGVISDVKPGAGRLLGLLSLTELPRHLALDFSEFKEGLKFKQILAQFDIVDGDAFTENLHIISPIALIDIDGRTGLAKHDYDLDVSVAPNVSKSLPVISWLAWGGQVGALTFLIDQLFGKDFNESIASTYRITGNWEKPQIKEIPRPKPATKENQP